MPCKILNAEVFPCRCTVCGKVSNRESNFYELDLSIQGHRQLKECIKEFLKVFLFQGIFEGI